MTSTGIKIISYKGKKAVVCESSSVSVFDVDSQTKKPMQNVLFQGSAPDCYGYLDYLASVLSWKDSGCKGDSPEFQAVR